MGLNRRLLLQKKIQPIPDKWVELRGKQKLNLSPLYMNYNDAISITFRFIKATDDYKSFIFINGYNQYQISIEYGNFVITYNGVTVIVEDLLPIEGEMYTISSNHKGQFSINDTLVASFTPSTSFVGGTVAIGGYSAGNVYYTNMDFYNFKIATTDFGLIRDYYAKDDITIIDIINNIEVSISQA